MAPPERSRHRRIRQRLGDGLVTFAAGDTAEDRDRLPEERPHPVLHGRASEIVGEQLSPEARHAPLPLIRTWQA